MGKGGRSRRKGRSGRRREEGTRRRRGRGYKALRKIWHPRRWKAEHGAALRAPAALLLPASLRGRSTLRRWGAWPGVGHICCLCHQVWDAVEGKSHPSFTCSKKEKDAPTNWATLRREIFVFAIRSWPHAERFLCAGPRYRFLEPPQQTRGALNGKGFL